ncbi:MAG TPA: shikimate dehydrogenase [Tepidiformaceae bacterium]|nr:shikimate dehydrogenase [Tepidiformaceae bacterium]
MTSADASPRRAGIIGRPVAQSLSPVFQRAAFAACGLDATYDAWDTGAEALHGRIVSLRGAGYLGANVTIPYKELVIPHLDELGGSSARVGAVNTIVNRAGRLYGFNTDGPGFVAALRNEAHFEPAGRTFLLLGAGGAARGIAFALAEAKAGKLTILNRSAARAERLAEDVSAVAGARATALTAEPARTLTEAYDCIVNCTSIGMHGSGSEFELPVSLDGVAPDVLVVDVVYAPEETPLLREARALGMPALGGLPMLIYQGALAFELWTGVPAPIDVMFDAARKGLVERAARAATT